MIIFSVYVVILVGAAGYYGLFLSTESSAEGEWSREDVNRASSDLRVNGQEGAYDDMEERFLQEEWSFDMGGEEELFLKYNNTDLRIYFKKGQSGQNQVDIAYYHVPSSIAGEKKEMDFRPEMNHSNKVLSIRAHSGEEEKEYIGYKKEFPFQQFEASNDSAPPKIEIGSGVIIMEVPEHIEVNTSGSRNVIQSNS
ncbi:hypothetical protein [Salibacterium aidingense]|uniref:hypothetical protein n=1 Tax=Salibacterium aidingense TaxID=384933 RepID=UPI003BC2F16D